jgi:hypothetical protein
MAKELIELRDRILSIATSDKTMLVALTTVMAIHKPRIFQGGQDSNKAKIGTYSTTPISISKKNQSRNTGKTYFKGGYAEYKRDIGKNPGFVNLRNTDQMMMDYGILIGGGSFGFGFHNKHNFDKSQWLQDKYDTDIFDLSDEELNILGNTLQTHIESQI